MRLTIALLIFSASLAAQIGSYPPNAGTGGSCASLAGDVTGTCAASVVGKINGVALSGLATGIVKNTTTTGVPSIAVAGDFPTLNQSTSGNAATATALAVSPTGCTNQWATGVAASGNASCSDITRLNAVLLSGLATGILKNTTGTGAPSIAVAGDFPTLNQNTSGTAANLSGTPALPNGTTGTTQSAGDSSTKLSTTAYTDTAVANAVSGVNPAVAVQAATAAVLPNSPTYSNGASGVGATLTAGSAAALVVDGYTPVLLDRILVKTQASTFQNGIYFLSTLGTGIIPYVLTRALDYDTPSNMNNTGAIPVVNGTANGTTQWVQTSKVTTVGTDAVTFAQFTLNPSVITQTIASGTSALGTSLISTVTCATVVTTSATGTATTDTIQFTPNASVKAVTGYAPATTGGLTVTAYPTANNVNFDVCNWSTGSITPGAVTLNWRVVR